MLYTKMINKYGKDILESGYLEQEKAFCQHGTISCYEHSMMVARMSLRLAAKIPAKIDRRSLVRGALLHDYFLYDWHVKEDYHKLHGFRHAQFALTNAMRDFELNEIEQDIIARHMFPLNLRPPKYRESVIVCIADKICAGKETIAARL